MRRILAVVIGIAAIFVAYVSVASRPVEAGYVFVAFYAIILGIIAICLWIEP